LDWRAPISTNLTLNGCSSCAVLKNYSFLGVTWLIIWGYPMLY
jgi:hypothetical protein